MTYKKKVLSEEHKKKISQSLKGNKKISGENNGMFGMSPWNKGKRVKCMEGDKNPAWKGGRRLDQYGYVCIRDNNKYVREHRIIMENHINRKVLSEEVIHHLDFDKTNNDIDNLHLFNNQTEHRAYHKFLRGIVAEALRGE